MINFYFNIKRLLNNRNGQGIIEYVLLVSLIALVLIATITLLGDSINNAFNNVGNLISNS